MGDNMARIRRRNSLNDTALRRGLPKGRHYDGRGDGLFFLSYGNRRGCWVQRIMFNGKRREFGLGGYPYVTLAMAREEAGKNKHHVRVGHDPRVIARRRKTGAHVPTFEEAAAAVLVVQKTKWRSAEKETKQWESVFRRYVLPKLGWIRVSDIESSDILDVLEPIWADKPAVAARVQIYLRLVMDWAIIKNYRKRNPVSSSLSVGLPARTSQPVHHPALHYSKVAGAVEAIQRTEALEVTKLLCEFIALTGVRLSEARCAVWSEIDLPQAIWTIPPHRMKRRKLFVLPLSKRAVAVLRLARKLPKDDDKVFPGNAKDGFLSPSTLTSLLKVQGLETVTHGFRSSFADWGAENGVNLEVLEHCLAHKLPNMTRRAYIRTDYFKARCVVMEDWAQYLFPSSAT